MHDTILLKLLHQNGIVLAKQIFYTTIIIAWHKTLFKPSILIIILKQHNHESEETMNKFYKAIEEKIKASGYPREISGRDVYNDICDQIEDKENGTYLVLSKFEDDVTFEYHITIQDEEFNLGVLTMRAPEGVFQTDFDE